MMTGEIGYGILNEKKELESDFMEHDYMCINGQIEVTVLPGTSRWWLKTNDFV